MILTRGLAFIPSDAYMPELSRAARRRIVRAQLPSERAERAMALVAPLLFAWNSIVVSVHRGVRAVLEKIRGLRA